MRKLPLRIAGTALLGMVILLIPVMMYAQTAPPQPGPPPIAPPLIREGSFAIKLEFALGVGTTDDEVEAENRLAEIGILPRNGWIADYPVTPDIIGELQQSVIDAAGTSKLSMDKEDARKRYNETLADVGLTVTPYAGGTYNAAPPGAENYPNPTVINNYYYNNGPPVVTCYRPPADFFYLYAWVPFPFLWFDFWFPGFFVLHDFHRTIFVNQRVLFVSNHFRDIRVNRVFRIDPRLRFQGRTFSGIGAVGRSGLLSTGIPGGERRIFNSPRNVRGGFMVNPPSTRSPQAPSRSGAIVAPPSRGGAVVVPPARGGVISPPARSGAPARAPSRGGGQRR